MKRIEHVVENGIEKKRCSKCKSWLPLSCFSKNRVKWDGLQERCDNCRKLHWNKIGKYTKTVIPLEIARIRRRTSLIKSYGLTNDEFDSMLKKQHHKCAICGTKDWGRLSPSIDHDHTTGKVRALLCNRCNRTLGLAGDSTQLLNKMIKYLKKHGK